MQSTGWPMKKAAHNQEIVFKIKFLSRWLDVQEKFNANSHFPVDKGGFGGSTGFYPF